jgi:FkbH-like protein
MLDSFGGPIPLRPATVPALPKPADKDAPSVLRRSLISWGEHCTECAMPSCYSSCQYYAPREDLRCQRFTERPSWSAAADGGEPWLDLQFGKWAVLMASGRIPMLPPERVAKAEKLDAAVSQIYWQVPLNAGFKTRLANWWSAHKLRWLADDRAASFAQATHFELEAFNHEADTIPASLLIREKSQAQNLFQHRLMLPAGHSRHRIPLGTQFSHCTVDSEFFINIVLDAGFESVRLSFRGLGAVEAERTVLPPPAAAKAGKARIAKCVVWDLDNTVWHGTLVEDGLERLRLREGVVDLIQELDRRGVLQSVASKNNPDEALKALAHFGLTEYFLYPQISWNPKSQSIQRIRELLNIGIDTFFFIDDQPFERAEVSSVLPDLTALDEAQITTLLQRPEFDLPVTAESSQRRRFYMEQIQRDVQQQSFSGDYEEFLRSSGMRLRLLPLNEEYLERSYELTQRTNQMNFAGGRYSRDSLAAMGQDAQLGCFVMSCGDKFGEYGVVGFAILDRTEGCIIDMMFSCRVQAKRVEHAFLIHVHQMLRAAGLPALKVRYRQTPKNTPVGQVFADLGFAVDPQDPEVRVLSTEEARTQDLVIVEVAP